jgi:hypothetical protein
MPSSEPGKRKQPFKVKALEDLLAAMRQEVDATSTKADIGMLLTSAIDAMTPEVAATDPDKPACSVDEIPEPPAPGADCDVIRAVADPDALLNAIRPLVDVAILKKIADADYGHGAEENLAILKTIRDEGVLPVPLDWFPHEVCALTRWETPKKDDRRGHIARLFACAILLRTSFDGETEVMGVTDTLIVALESAAVLGVDFVDAYVRWAASGIDNADTDNDFIGASIVLARGLGSTLVDATGCDALLGWVTFRLETWTMVHEVSPGNKPKGLLDWTFFNQRHSVWHALLERSVKGLSAAGEQAIGDKLVHLLKRGPLSGM